MTITDQKIIKRLTHPKCSLCKKTIKFEKYTKLKPILCGKYRRSVCDKCFELYPQKAIEKYKSIQEWSVIVKPREYQL